MFFNALVLFLILTPTEEVTATCYHPTVAQCDSDPLITASLKKINESDPLSHRWIAISRDLKEFYNFGDAILVLGTKDGIYDGIWIVNDLMNKRWEKKIDFLVGENDYIDKFENVTIRRIILVKRSALTTIRYKNKHPKYSQQQ